MLTAFKCFAAAGSAAIALSIGMSAAPPNGDIRPACRPRPAHTPRPAEDDSGYSGVSAVSAGPSFPSAAALNAVAIASAPDRMAEPASIAAPHPESANPVARATQASIDRAARPSESGPIMPAFPVSFERP